MKITDELLEQYAPEAAEQMLADLPEDADLPRHQFSPEFERKVRRMDKKARPRWQRWLRSSVAAVLACAILGGFCVTPAGAYVYEQVWRFVKLHVDPDNGAEMTVPLSFGYLPEGFEKVSEEEILENCWIIFFETEEGRYMTVMQLSIDSENSAYREITTDGGIECISVDGEEYYVITEPGTCGLYWSRGAFEYHITGNLDIQTMLEVAKNIF